MSEPSKKQLELEQSIFSISGYNKISKNNKLREQGRESETYYARNMIEAGLEELTNQTQNYIYKSLSGQVGVKSLAAIYLNQFPDIDVVSFITFKVIIDNVSLRRLTLTLKFYSNFLDNISFIVFSNVIIILSSLFY